MGRGFGKAGVDGGGQEILRQKHTVQLTSAMSTPWDKLPG